MDLYLASCRLLLRDSVPHDQFKAHDEENIARDGDIVKIMATRPLSATKRFRLVEVVKKAEII